MADWSKPTLADSYANFQDLLKARDFDAISLGLGTITAPQAGMMRYVRASNLFQEYDGANWINKVISVAGGGTGATTPGGAIGALGLGTMALQNSNNVNITGGAITSLSTLSVSGDPYFANNLTVQAGIFTGGGIDINGSALFRNNVTVNQFLTVTNNINAQASIYCNGAVVVDTGLVRALDVQALRDLSAGHNLSVTGNIGCARIDTTGVTVSAGDVYCRGIYRAGPSDRQVTYSDGRTYGGNIGSGYTGGGTRVLTDNDQWVDMNLVGGGVREVVHQNMSFGTDELVKDIVVPWGGAQPVSAKNWHLQFDQPYSDNSSVNGGPVFYSVIYLGPNQARITRTPGPGAVAPITASTVVYTAFHHRTEVN